MPQENLNKWLSSPGKPDVAPQTPRIRRRVILTDDDDIGSNPDTGPTLAANQLPSTGAIIITSDEEDNRSLIPAAAAPHYESSDGDSTFGVILNPSSPLHPIAHHQQTSQCTAIKSSAGGGACSSRDKSQTPPKKMFTASPSSAGKSPKPLTNGGAAIKTSSSPAKRFQQPIKRLRFDAEASESEGDDSDEEADESDDDACDMYRQTMLGLRNKGIALRQKRTDTTVCATCALFARYLANFI